MTDPRHPLDLAWASLPADQRRNHARAEALAFYLESCREWHAPCGRSVEETAAAVDALVDAVIPI